MKDKLIALGIVILLLIGLGFTITIQNNRISKLNDTISIMENNRKATELENSNLKDKAIEYQYTIKQINNSNDSLLNKLNQTRRELKIKDKEITALQYLASQNSKVDSIVVRDTIFQKGVSIDTTIGDHWSQLAIRAEYPNILNVDYSFNNETVIFLHDSRVTVNPPKKCWIGRLFQKKQTIVEVDIVQENPYCTNKTSKFIKILK